MKGSLLTDLELCVNLRDRMVHVNRGLKDGRTRYELGMTAFESKLLEQSGNHDFAAVKDETTFVMVFNLGVLRKVIDQIQFLTKAIFDLNRRPILTQIERAETEKFMTVPS